MQNSVEVTICPEPFSFKRIDYLVVENLTIAEILEKCFPVLLCPGTSAKVFINDQLIPKTSWSTARPSVGDIVNIRVIPSGGEGKDPMRTVLTLLVIAAAAWAGPAAAGWAVADAASLTGSLISAGVSTAVTVVGMLAVNALVPLPSPNKADEDYGDLLKRSATIRGGQNRINRYGPIPVVLGVHRVVPPYGAMPYTEIVGNDQYLRMLYVIGYGPLMLGNFKFGDIDISSLEDVEMEVREGYDTDDPITLYTSDVYEESLNIELTSGAGYITQTTQDGCDEISVDITFPQGLFTINSDGSKTSAFVSFEIQYAVHGTSDWTVGTGYEAIDAQISDSMPATGSDYVIRYDRVVINKYSGVISTILGTPGPDRLAVYHSSVITQWAEPPRVPDWACKIAKIRRGNTSTISASDITDERDSCLKKQNAGDFAPSAQSPESDKIDIAAGNLKFDPSFFDASSKIIRLRFLKVNMMFA